MTQNIAQLWPSLHLRVSPSFTLICWSVGWSVTLCNSTIEYGTYMFKTVLEWLQLRHEDLKIKNPNICMHASTQDKNQCAKTVVASSDILVSIIHL